MSLNKYLLTGHVGDEPIQIQGEGKQKAVKISVASNRKKTNEKGEKERVADWFDVVCFGKTADFVEQYVTKGSHVYVEAYLSPRSYKTQSGDSVKSNSVVANKVEFL